MKEKKFLELFVLLRHTLISPPRARASGAFSWYIKGALMKKGPTDGNNDEYHYQLQRSEDLFFFLIFAGSHGEGKSRVSVGCGGEGDRKNENGS